MIRPPLELLGGRFGEMSTLNNYLHQSTAMRAKKQLGPFYELVASMIAVVGMVCLIRILSPPEWKNWGWIGGLIASVLFVGFMQLV